MYGDAADEATSVNLKSAMSIKVSANSTGYFELDIDSRGAPKGEFLITAGEIEKAVEIVSAEDMPVSTPTPSSSPIPSPSPSPISSPQKTTRPFPIPGVGFEAIGCIAIAVLILSYIYETEKALTGEFIKITGFIPKLRNNLQ